MGARVGIVAGVAALAACAARIDGGGDGPLGGADAPVADAGGVDAMLGLWGVPTPIGPAATSARLEDDGTVDATETELVFSGRPPGGIKDLYRMTRPTALDPWGTPALVPQLNSAQADHTPRFSADGLTVYFASNRAGGSGSDDIWTATRPDRASPFGTPTVMPAINSPQSERTYTPCAGNRYVMISFRNGTGDVFEGIVGQAPVFVPTLSSPTATETGTFVRADCRELWFASNRDGDIDIFRGYRAAVGDPWLFGGKVMELSTVGVNESDPWVSPDLHRMVFASDLDGELDLYMSTR